MQDYGVLLSMVYRQFTVRACMQFKSAANDIVIQGPMRCILHTAAAFIMIHDPWIYLGVSWTGAWRFQLGRYSLWPTASNLITGMSWHVDKINVARAALQCFNVITAN